ncbi:hypothetical protein TWF191_006042 [Orbilia oligospora]|uniref:Uncharacterized protein n=1 Tax=Orbilia oligospora TaxID=2813651 RepID=A0A7C8V075_ORBOL|nr:hypothetical protein TWF191_006042 [Orbilia oligospora]
MASRLSTGFKWKKKGLRENRNCAYFETNSHYIRTPEAEAVLENDDIDKVLDVLKTALDVGVTVAAAAAPGVAGGAALMSGLAAIGGSAVGGILVVAGVPAFMAGNTLRKVIKRHENNTDTNDTVVVGMVTGGIVGSATAVGSVFAGGSVVGLSGAGITSGLASLGGGAIASGGLGMLQRPMRPTYKKSIEIFVGGGVIKVIKVLIKTSIMKACEPRGGCESNYMMHPCHRT